MQKNILIYALSSCAIFIMILLSFKYLNMLHFWGLRSINYVIFALISIYQVRQWIKRYHGYVPFLHVFFGVLFTGCLAFGLLAVFILIYALYDPYITELFIGGSKYDGKLTPVIVLFFEGSAASIIISLLAIAYSNKFEDGEASLPR